MYVPVMVAASPRDTATTICDNAAKPEGSQMGQNGTSWRHEESPSDSTGPTAALPRAGVPLQYSFALSLPH